jgi:type VI secretion system protein ImpH
MAGSGGQPQPDLIQELLRAPESFDFFQAVRLLERAALEQAGGRAIVRLGSTDGPVGEVLRFHALQSLTFPPGEIAALQPATEPASGKSAGPLHMTVSFIGLTGPAGVLPEHYTSLIIERSHLRLKDHTLREFFDLFNHRVVSLFFRAWEKYRFPFAYERRVLEGHPDDDLFTQCLKSLTGLGIRPLQDQLAFDDQTILYYGGLFARQIRCVTGLEQILTSYFDLNARVEQFQGQWLYLPEEAQSSMPAPRHPAGLNLNLGNTAVAGSRIWDVQSRIRIRLGPLNWHRFRNLLPGSTGLQCVADMTRLYVGVEMDFDIQLELQHADVPKCRLASESAYVPQLGWNTWIGSDPQQRAPASDAVFRF